MAENPADKAKQDALYEDREPKKIIRIITVTAYMISVSFVGIVLSTYYIFLWNPPNPRLMHAQAIASHSERLMDDGPLASRRFADDRLDLMPAGNHPELDGDDESRLKARRQIVENVNAILRANYERNRLLAAPSRSPAAALDDDISANSSSSFLLDNATSSSPEPSPASPVGSTSPVVSEQSTTSTGSTESPATTPPKPSRSFAKKQHQTPFALKHLQEPIKFEGLRKRPTRIMTTTRMPTTTTTDPTTASTLTPAVDSSEAKGNSGDKAAPAFTTMETFNSAESSSPSQPSRSLYKILTTPAYRRNEDEASLSSDQPERFAPEQREDYQDGTIVPADAILDD